jgi:hypothetical protein
VKLYRVTKGTTGKLIKVGADTQPEIKDWTVRKDLTFMDTIIDPVMYHNRPGDFEDPLHIAMVQGGYALFANASNPRYILAVQYEDVGVLC